MSIAQGNRVNHSTQDFMAAKVVDTVLGSNVGLTRIMSAAKAGSWRGSSMKITMQTQENTTATSFIGGDTLSTASTDLTQQATFNPAFYDINVTLNKTELSVNEANATEMVRSLEAQKMNEAANGLASRLGTDFYSDGTGNGGKNMLGLEAIVDDGTNTTTYGSLTRTTYPSINATVTSSSGTLTLAKMGTLYSSVSNGSNKPTVGLTTETVWNLYETLLQPQERIYKTDISMTKGTGMTGGTGFTGLYYKGFPILADEKCTSGVLYFVNEKTIEWYALPFYGSKPIKYKTVIEGNDYSVEGLGFSWTGFIESQNQASYVGHINVSGELVCDNPRYNGKLTAITSV